jgi:hypothetical protein
MAILIFGLIFCQCLLFVIYTCGIFIAVWIGRFLVLVFLSVVAIVLFVNIYCTRMLLLLLLIFIILMGCGLGIRVLFILLFTNCCYRGS